MLSIGNQVLKFAAYSHRSPLIAITCQSCVRTLSYAVPKENITHLSPKVRSFVEERARLCQPNDIHISDVARVESQTYISTHNKRDTIPTPKDGVKGTLGNWMSREDLDNALNQRFPGCMKGRTMFVIPFSMGPIGSPLSKIGIEVTDSPYVVASMRIMTRMGAQVLKTLGNDDFIKCMHSIGQPLPMKTPAVANWPCNPSQTIIAHIPENNEISSFGSGYGGNSLLGKKCFALRLGSILARREGWFAEHMLILGITNPKGVKKYIAAAFPSACGKTNLAMMTPSLPGFKVECVGDDIAWMRFDDNGVLRAINPEFGFFGVAPGTSEKTNPNAMSTIQRNTIFTNVAKTADGGFYWEGLEHQIKGKKVQITSWLGDKNWTLDSDKPSSHPNSRFCTPASQCPIMDPLWEDPKGETPIGFTPKTGAINTDNMNENVDFDELFSVPKDFWLEECDRIRNYFTEQVNNDLPDEVWNQLKQLQQRLQQQK
ncbi:unnamed protein product [Medioppia subpectinata]|uniref:Phosphoenolpyruvate carboxykinase [GTP] n=1 Tax=Medioppia subpectinata TaxID=1979941 RepID=A0A7R9KNE0_9ACAR|nr:unnamed protein product [Medioppia subpectinata]CAG2105473.1 unnamed protein product [Medioppia subpectinata]